MGFKISNDPRFEEKLVDVVALYLDAPEHAIVLSVDEKSQIQALDRTQPGLPMKKGRCGTMAHDYKRNGTTTLFAALNTLDGTVISETMPRHRHHEWLRLLKRLHRATPKRLALHIICDNVRHSQASGGEGVVGDAHPRPCSLHADECIVAEHGGAIFPRHHREPHPQGRFQVGPRTRSGHPHLHRESQRSPKALHLDRCRERYPRQSRLSEEGSGCCTYFW